MRQLVANNCYHFFYSYFIQIVVLSKHHVEYVKVKKEHIKTFNNLIYTYPDQQIC